MDAIAELLASQGVIVCDGGMGTQLFERGLTAGDSPERWNVEHPDLIQAIHTEYIGA